MPASVFAFDKVPFERRLAETIGWCTRRAPGADPRTSLRSEQMCPGLLSVDRATTVADVVGHRANIVGPVQPVDARDSLRGGRLLVYFPDDDLACGAAEVQSKGFFDVHNVPPWDTWIALADDGRLAASSFRQYVIAWVPPDLVACASEGIEVNPEQCIAWLEDTEVRARAELRHLLR